MKMTWQDIAIGIELVLLVFIWLDGRVMKFHAKESVDLQRKSLEAQQAYLDLRRKWYDSRLKKKEEKNVPTDSPKQEAGGPAPSIDSNAL